MTPATRVAIAALNDRFRQALGIFVRRARADGDDARSGAAL
jgi:hypothetical protein